MAQNSLVLPSTEGLSLAIWIDLVCDQYERDINASQTSRLQEYLQAAPEDCHQKLLVELLLLNWEVLGPQKDPPSPRAECQDYPRWVTLVQSAWRRFEQRSLPPRPLHGSPSLPNNTPPTGESTCSFIPNRKEEETEATGVLENSTTHGHKPANATRPIPIGYALHGLLGKGGFGEVWMALGPGEIKVAFKFVSLRNSAGSLEQQALTVIREIRHPGLISIFGTWQSSDWLTIGMELADRTLLQRFEEAVQETELGIEPKELLRYMLETAKILDFLNKPRHYLKDQGKPAGIQHGDVKPQNIFLFGDGVKLGDYGLVRLLESNLAPHQGGLTVAYAAPEVLNGQISRWSDQFALAVTYYQMRCGTFPFRSGSRAELPRLEQVPTKEQEVLQRALTGTPSHRWPSCRTFVKELNKAVRHQRTQTDSTPLQPSVTSSLSEHRSWSGSPEPRTVYSSLSSKGRKALFYLIVIEFLACLTYVVGLFAGWDTIKELFSERIPHWVKEGPLQTAGNITKPILWLTGSITALYLAWVLLRLLRRQPTGVAHDSDEERQVQEILRRSTLQCSGGSAARSELRDVEERIVITKSPRYYYVLDGFADSVWDVMFSRDGSTLLAGSLDGTVQVWDTTTERLLKKFEGHQDGVTCVRFVEVDFVSNNTRESAEQGCHFVSSSVDGTIRIWGGVENEQQIVLRGHEGRVLCLGVAPNSRRIASGGEDSTIRIWDLQTGKGVAQWDTKSGFLSSVLFTRTAGIISSGEDRFIRFWDESGSSQREFEAHQQSLTCLTLSHDEKVLASGSKDGTVRIWDLATGELIHHLGNHTDWVRSVAFSSDRQILVSGGDDETVCVWNTTTGELSTRYQSHEGSVLSLAVSPWALYVATASEDCTIHLYPLDGKESNPAERYPIR